jgi:hypothetical protein
MTRKTLEDATALRRAVKELLDAIADAKIGKGGDYSLELRVRRLLEVLIANSPRR